MSEYPILDNADCKQIESADVSVLQSLAYDLRGKKQISFAGIKWLVLNMSRHEEPLTIDVVDLHLERYTEEQSSWVWYATVKARNGKTGLETLGASEQAFVSNGRVDPFSRTKALSKAERNAYRKQIPELEIKQMLDAAEPGQIQRLETRGPEIHPGVDGVNATHPPSQKQIEYMRDLGYTGEIPKSLYEATILIHDLKKEKLK